MGTHKIHADLDVDGSATVAGNTVKGYATGTRTINSTSYTMIGTVAGDRLASVVELTLTGTSGNVVIGASFEITVMHSQDIFVKSMNGDYKDVKIKITSDNNEDFSIEAMHTATASDTPLEVCIFPKAGETCVVTGTDPGYNGLEHEHTAFEGTCFSANDNSTTGHRVLVNGELEASALDINGNADISGNITSAGWTGDVIASAYLDSDTAHVTQTQTLTNKTLTSPVLNTGVSGTAIKDEDDMTSNSATHLATQQSIKAYVDSSVSSAGGGDMLLGTAQNITAHKEFQDGIIARFGNDADLDVYHSGSGGFIDNKTGDLIIKNTANAGDIILQGDNGSSTEAYITVDGGSEIVRIHKPLYLNDHMVHIGDDNTKFGFSAADTFEVRTGGTARLTVTNSSVAATTFAGDLNGTINTATTATTQSASDNSTKVATTAYVDTQVATLVDSAPGALNTLNELAAAINDDASFSTTITNSIATKMPLAGGTFTGAITMGGDTNMNGNSIYETAEDYYSIDLKDHSDYTWLRNVQGVWTFQMGTGGDNWTNSFHLTLPDPGSTANAVFAELGQKTSNVSDGRYKGVRIVKYASNALADGDLKAAEVIATSLDVNGNADISGALDVNGNLAVEDEIHLTDGGSTVRGKLLLNSSDRDNVELRAESLGSTMKFFTVGTEALLLDASQNATFAGAITIPEYINHTGDGNTTFGFGGADDFRVTVGGTKRLNVITTGVEIAGNLTGGTNATFSGEVEGGSLDINGNADISGSLTLGSTLTLPQNDHIITDGSNFLDENDDTLISIASGVANITGSSASCTGNAATATKISSITNSNIVQLSTTTTQTGTKTFSGVIDITNTTDSTNATGDTGALRCEGGASIAKKLYVGSTITGSADVIAYSDERLKKNVKTLDGKKVLEMRGVSFERTDSGKQSSGVIAQEMEKVAPELVIDDGSYKGVAYGNLVGYLIEAVKDQQKQIDELKAMINGSSR